ncbi:hypothetical protein MOB18_05960 [Bacillus inaquosorum]|uniref:hypothetical protein n=1 Tax=Bacillus inaquosorum TaxID=483913 RepID=UPI00228276FA|nr:hypothetical protein [Bacillus inaquosorum]MCY7748658.1 hypothetical protein [Bacillus inaquosorum]
MSTILDANIGQVISVYDLGRNGFHWGVLKEIDTNLNLIKLEMKVEDTGETFIRYFPLATTRFIQEGKEPFGGNCQ